MMHTHLICFFVFFTFHSGYIPIKSACVASASFKTFTFHSGYIPIWKKFPVIAGNKPLYIPFWIYSNGSTKEYISYLGLALHSILDIFQWNLGKNLHLILLPLHSILDIFQWSYGYCIFSKK